MIELTKQFIKSRFFLFLIVGGINTVFGYAIFCFFIFIGLNYALAALLGTICGILFNFKTTGSIVFKSHDNKLIFRFFTVYAATYIVNIVYLKIFLPYSNAYILGAVSILPLAVLSYYLNKKFVFFRTK